MTAPLGIIAGAGDLPVDLAARAAAEGRAVFVIRLKGFADPRLAALPGAEYGVGKIGAIIARLKSAGCAQAIFCGKVLRPRLTQLHPDWGGLKVIVPTLTGAWGRDDALHRAIAAAFERRGIAIVGPTELWPDLLAPQGQLTVRAPGDADWADIHAGAHGALGVGVADRGQGAVARGGAVVAVEDRTHTDGLLRRAAELPGQGGVLVKLAKPHQDRRVDLPVIGPGTVANAAAARLSGIAVEAGAAMIVHREATIAAADAAGLFLIGIPAP